MQKNMVTVSVLKYYAQDMSKQVIFLTQTRRNFKTLDNYQKTVLVKFGKKFFDLF